MRGGRSAYSVGQPLHRNPPNPATRCDPRLAHPSGAWRLFKQIVTEYWDACTHAPPRYRTSSYESLGAKMRACGAPEPRGSVAYRCLQGGQGQPLVSMCGTSSLGVRGAQGSGDTWVRPGSRGLQEGVSSRPLILTVPAMFRPPVSPHAAVRLL